MYVDTPRKIVVLFVDDEKHVVESLKDAMRRLPMTVLTATSGVAALRILAATPVDVVVSDELMPHMSGTELLATVRLEFPKIIRIILTGHAAAEAALRATDEGEVYRFVFKPCDSAELAQTIFEGVRTRHLASSSRRLLRQVRSGAPSFDDLQPAESVASGPVRPMRDPITEQDLSITELIHQIDSQLAD